MAFLSQYAFFDKCVDFARGGILRDLANLRPLGRGEIAVKPIEKSVEHLALVRTEHIRCVLAPEVSFGQYGCKLRLGGLHRTQMASKKPLHPPRDV